MEFLSTWSKDFASKIDPVVSKMVAEAQQTSSHDPNASLGRNLEDEVAFDMFPS
jgi:hypothetical protein